MNLILKPGFMNICMVVHAHYPHDESRVQREAIALSEKGHKVDVICLRKGKEPSRGHHDGVNFYRLPVRKRANTNLINYFLEYSLFFLLAGLKLTVLFLEKGYGIVQIHNLPYALVGVALIPKIFGARIVLDIHDLEPELYSAKFNIGMHHPLVKLLLVIEKLSCWFADRVLIVTDIWRKKLLERSVAGKKCSVLMNLPDDSIFKPVSIKKRDKYFNLIYHGTLVERYGVDIAIRAVSILKNKIPEIRLSIIGQGEELSELIHLTEELSLEDKVYFNRKFVPVDEIPEIIAKMDVGIVPNRLNIFTQDILNAKLLEYVSMDIPAVASRTPGIEYYFDEEMVAFFEAGNVEELASRILWLYNNPKEREKLVANAKKFFEQHSWKKEKERYYRAIFS